MLSADWRFTDRTASEAERIRALIMNIHSMLRGTEAAHLVAGPIEDIHRSLDRIEEESLRRTRVMPVGNLSVPAPRM